MVIFVPMIIDLISIPFGTGINNPLSVFFILLPSLLLLLLSFVFLLFIGKNYCIYFITDFDFRDALIFALKNNSIIFEERMNKIELVELKNTIKVMYYSIYGIIGIKNRKDKEIFKKIIKDIKIYFEENKIKSKKISAIYFLVAGILVALSIIFLTYFLNNMDKFFSFEA
jgi:hypothetical protein